MPLVIVGAHYDSLPGTPGADDNASAVAALLELAAWIFPRLAAEGRPTARLQLAAYDQEEDGLVGSHYHSGTVAGAVKGMISLEMLAYVDHRPGSQQLPPHLKGLNPDVGDFIGVVGNEAVRGLLETMTAGLKAIDGLPVESMAVPGDGTLLPETRLSDHASFWDRGLRALMITDTSFFRNPHYHKAQVLPCRREPLSRHTPSSSPPSSQSRPSRRRIPGPSWARRRSRAVATTCRWATTRV